MALSCASLFGQFSYATDPADIVDKLVQTQNGLGANFNDLGAFETKFIQECHTIAHQKDTRVLFNGVAYGRLPHKVMQEVPGKTEFFVNELDFKNLKHFVVRVQKMASGQPASKRNAARVHVIPGNCLQLESNNLFKKFLPNNQSHQAFDLIMADNFIHFFKGSEVLDFFIQSFNQLKPGGRLFVFNQHKIPVIPLNGNPMSVYSYCVNAVMNTAKEDPNILFPGLIHDDWIDRSEIMHQVFKTKPNGKHLCNSIPLESLQKVSAAVGFATQESIPYSLMIHNNHMSFEHFAEGDQDYAGSIFVKPENYAGGLLTRAQLNPEFVRLCDESFERMRDFVATRIQFESGLPVAITHN